MNRSFLVILMAAAGVAVRLAAQDPAATAAQAKQLEAARVAEVVKTGQLAVQSRITTGAPYSADAVTESTQALPDGNRIARKTIARVYRDGEGRTRREQIDAENGTVQSVSISDPIAGSTYTLDPMNKIATKNSVMVATPSGFATVGGGGGRGGGGAIALRTPEPAGGAAAAATAADLEKVQRAMEAEKAAPSASTMPRQVEPIMPLIAPSGGGGRGRGSADGSQTTREDLGQQTVEGVPATGTRSTTVIPAGAIGNLQPIKIVSEQWMSPDLKVLILTKHSDPRTGETIYRLSNIVRAEPDRSLFMVPPDYTLKETRLRRQPQ
jgi:hypothetical protein